MSDMGPRSFGKKEEQIFLGREISQHRDYSEATAIRIDEAVHAFVDEGYKRARGIIEEHHDAMVRVAEALLQREVLDGAEVMQLIRGEELAASNRPNKSNDDKPPAAPLPVRPEGGLRMPPLVDGPQPA